MFAFFVVMFATAQTDKTKAREVAATAREALQHGQLTSTLEGIILLISGESSLRGRATRA